MFCSNCSFYRDSINWQKDSSHVPLLLFFIIEHVTAYGFYFILDKFYIWRYVRNPIFCVLRRLTIKKAERLLQPCCSELQLQCSRFFVSRNLLMPRVCPLTWSALRFIVSTFREESILGKAELPGELCGHSARRLRVHSPALVRLQSFHEDCWSYPDVHWMIEANGFRRYVLRAFIFILWPETGQPG